MLRVMLELDTEVFGNGVAVARPPTLAAELRAQGLHDVWPRIMPAWWRTFPEPALLEELLLRPHGPWLDGLMAALPSWPEAARHTALRRLATAAEDAEVRRRSVAHLLQSMSHSTSPPEPHS